MEYSEIAVYDNGSGSDNDEASGVGAIEIIDTTEGERLKSDELSDSAKRLINLAKNETIALDDTQRDALKEIEGRVKRRAFIPSDVIDLVGVVAGVKPAAIIQPYTIGDIEAVAKDLHISCRVIDEISEFAVSRYPELSNELARMYTATQNGGRLTESAHRAIGELLGYPKTATDYFIARADTLDTSDELPMVVPRPFIDTVDGYFHSFVLSPDHYKEEVEAYCRPLQAATKEWMPDTYKYLERAIQKDQRINRIRAKIAKMSFRTLCAESSQPPFLQKFVDLD